jgi:aerobic C4-dicarboxylate transport protein
MDSMRVVVNLLGNSVAVFAVSKWEGALDLPAAQRALSGDAVAIPAAPEEESEEVEETAVPVAG